jgi:hypothetical protein
MRLVEKHDAMIASPASGHFYSLIDADDIGSFADINIHLGA